MFRNSPQYQNCEVAIIPKILHKEHISFGFQKDSPYLPLFNYQIQIMQENGVFDQIFEKYKVQKQECPGPSLSLGFENCITAFFPIIVGLVISLILFVVEFHPNSWTKLSIFLNYYNQTEQSNDLFYTVCTECKKPIDNVSKIPGTFHQEGSTCFENQRLPTQSERIFAISTKELPEPID